MPGEGGGVTHLAGGDLLDLERVFEQRRGGEVLLHVLLQDLDAHVRVVDLSDTNASVTIN